MTTPRKRTDEPRVFCTDDARHAACLYQMQPSLEPADLHATVDQFVNSGFDTLLYTVGVEGGAVVYDSHVVPKWGDNVTSWTHPVWYRAALNLRQLIADGHDPLQIMVDRANQKGIWFFAGNWVNFNGTPREQTGGLGRTIDWFYDNPQFQVGPEDDPRAEHLSAGRFNFLHDEVRALRLAMFSETLARHQTDGVDLDLLTFAPLCRFDQTDQLAPVLTQWLRDLRAAADKAAQQQNRAKRIFVRIPAHPGAWPIFGYDVPAWIADGLVDGLICSAGVLHAGIDHSHDLTPVTQLARGTNCRVFAGISALLGRQVSYYATPPLLHAAAANAYAQGAHGCGIGDCHWTPHGWPLQPQDYGTARPLGDPDLLAVADKHYHAQSVTGRPHIEWFPGADRRLPITLAEGKPVTVPLYIADDLPHYQQRGRIDAVRLHVRISSIEVATNAVRVELNGQPLPDHLLDINDIGYRMIETGSIGPYGCIYQYTLDPDHYPNPGRNEITVTLTQRDPHVEIPFDLYDVDCFVDYRLHRNYHRDPLNRNR
ncbi:MAG: hypothetical protein CMJ49_08180 [Planctomycetaceae bacterium]|nr:hypothetical protein [Planctomycetaceae bacterium]